MKWRAAGGFMSFRGRVGRGAFWAVQVGFFVGLVVVGALFEVHGALGLVAFVPLWVVGLATSVKRWHDRNKSGAWVFINFVPFVGGVWSLIEQGFLRGTPGDNQYGAPGSGSPFGPGGRTTGPARGMRVDTSGLRPGMTDEEVVAAWRGR